MDTTSAKKIIVKGIVQGVGFRPRVYALANAMKLNGWVKNTNSGVEIVLLADCVDDFINLLMESLPPLANVESITVQSIELEHEIKDFEIITSDTCSLNDVLIPPDNYVCHDCIRDIFDPDSRYYLYPFTSCTNCGPRYTVINQLPYDKKNTTLANFRFCNECSASYHDPNNRRYHAESSVCDKCGPKLTGQLSEITNSIQEGQIVALKSVGGYALLADATNSMAVSKLRIRKNRPAKPFAVMVLNTISIQTHYAELNSREEQLLTSKEAPIVLLKRKNVSNISHEVAPDLATIGVMLPNSPLHYLLFYYLLGMPHGYNWLNEAHDIVLIFTSANSSGSAIISDDEEAENSLAMIADSIFGYNRKISMRCDDSLIMSLPNHDILLRHARGLAPKAYYFNYSMPQVLGVGAELKNTITYIRDNKAYLSQYMGDMSGFSANKYFVQVIRHYQHIFNFAPLLVVSDLHPDFYTTQYAENLGIQHVQLQHHYAHFASVIANQQSIGISLDNVILGCILDGYGYGNNGESWGGEILKFDSKNFEFEHISQITPIIIPGGDKAEQEPWRIATSMCIENDLPLPHHLENHANAGQLIAMMAREQFAHSTAFGRLFSAVAGLLDVVKHASYEAHAAMILEAMVTQLEINDEVVSLNINGQPEVDRVFRYIYQIGVVEKNIQRAVNSFYGCIIALLEKWIIFHCKNHKATQVAISGGCWQSRFLLPNLESRLSAVGIKLLVPYQLPVNDEAISFGQAWYGAQLILRGKISCV